MLNHKYMICLRLRLKNENKNSIRQEAMSFQRYVWQNWLYFGSASEKMADSLCGAQALHKDDTPVVRQYMYVLLPFMISDVGILYERMFFCVVILVFGWTNRWLRLNISNWRQILCNNNNDLYVLSPHVAQIAGWKAVC